MLEWIVASFIFLNFNWFLILLTMMMMEYQHCGGIILLLEVISFIFITNISWLIIINLIGDEIL